MFSWNLVLNPRFDAQAAPSLYNAIIPGRCQQSMAAIHTLPIEILSRIFLLGQPAGEYPEFPPIGPPPFEVLVSHVCQHWRQVALRTPHLWTTIHLRTVPHIDRAKQYLRRSGRLPLDILVDTCDIEEHIKDFLLFRDEFMPVFSILTPYIDRWRSMQIKVRDRQCKLGARQVLSTCGPARNLEFLQLWHVETWETAERLFTQIGPPPVVVFNKSLPSLKHIKLIGVNLPWVHSPFLEDLTSVDFGLHADDVRIPYNLWERMMATSPHLERLSLHYSGPRFGAGEWPNTCVKLLELRELNLEEMPTAILLQLFARLHMPNLSVLRLTLPSLDDGEDSGALLDFCTNPPPLLPLIPEDDEEPQGKGKGKAKAKEEDSKREGPLFRSLDTLQIYALECSAKHFGAFLNSHRSIRHLTLDCARMPDGLFDELMVLHSTSTKPPATSDSDARSSADPEPSAAQSSESERRGEGSASGSREGSAESSDAGSSPRSPSTAITTPNAEYAQLPSTASSAPQQVVLPLLQSLKISGLLSETLCEFIRFRREHGCPVQWYRVSESMRSDELEGMVEEMAKNGRERLTWEEDDEEEEDDESQPGDEDYVEDDYEAKEDDECCDPDDVAEGGSNGRQITSADYDEELDEPANYSDGEEEEEVGEDDD